MYWTTNCLALQLMIVEVCVTAGDPRPNEFLFRSNNAAKYSIRVFTSLLLQVKGVEACVMENFARHYARLHARSSCCQYT